MEFVADKRKEKARRYRKKLKADALKSQISRRKAKERSQKYRNKFIELAKTNNKMLEERKEKNRIRQQKYRAEKKCKSQEANLNIREMCNNYKCKQTFGKALKKAEKPLPVNLEKRKQIVDNLHNKYGTPIEEKKSY